MPEIQCAICQDSFSLDEFRFYNCGHGFCETCLEQARSQPTCAVCRWSKGNDEPRHVYISFMESSAQEPEAVAEPGGSEVEMNHPSASIQLNIQELKGKAEQVADVDCREGLLMVAGNLEEGVSDLVSELERERTTKRTLMEDIRLLEVKLAEMQESEAEVVRLRSNLGGMSDLASELERERTTNRALREETELLKVRLAEAQTEARESETEVVRLRGELEEGISDLVSELERERMTNRTLKNEPKLFEVKLAEEKQLEMAAVRLRRKLEGMSDLVSELGRGGTTSSTLRKGTRLLEVKVTEAQTEAQKSETAVVRLRRKLEGMSDLVSELERERTANRTLRKETKLLEGKCGEAQTEADKSEMAVARLRRKLEGMSVLESELERERTTNRTLRKETKLLEGKRAEAQTGAQKSEAEVVQLRKKLREANANYKSAASSAEEALGRVQSHRKASEKKDAEIRELRATVKQKGNESRLWKNKLQALARQATNATQDPDDEGW